MGRLALFALVCGCSYSAPNDPGQPTPDTPETPDPDAPLPDSMTVEPDGPPDAPLPPVSSDFVASADTYLDSISPNTTFGGDLLTDGSPSRVTLMRFDLSGLSTATQIVSAELHVFSTTDEGNLVTVFPVLEPWSESSATWNSRSFGMQWASAGASPPSRGTTAIASFTPNLENTEFTSTVDTTTVQKWVATPDSNLGMVFTSLDEDGSFLRSRASSNGKPFLRVVHIP